MQQFHLYAFEVADAWHISMSSREIRDDGEPREGQIYRGMHVSIDDEDPLIRAVLLLHQVHSDLEAAIAGNTDILVDGPMHH